MSYDLGKMLIDGGEGFIYEVVGHPEWLIKIYKDADTQGNPIVTTDLVEKLEYMKNNPPQRLIDQNVLAWPIETIYENNRFRGLIMPRLAFDSNLKDVCSYKHPISDTERDVSMFPSVKARVMIAVNLVSTIHELHKAGYIIGDMNHENIGINRQTGRICIVDCDSFHITLPDRTYRTKYVMPGYLAPEIIEHCYSERANGRPYLVNDVALPTFTQESDLFCLAKHIFKLLMNGTDPFTGVLENTLGSAASPFQGNEAIERNAYVFKAGYYAKARFCLNSTEFPDYLMQLFNKAFVLGNSDPRERPTTEEWYVALNKYIQELIPCEVNQKHHYMNTLSYCPFCEADTRWKDAQISALGYSPTSPDSMVKKQRRNAPSNATAAAHGAPAIHPTKRVSSLYIIGSLLLIGTLIWDVLQFYPNFITSLFIVSDSLAGAAVLLTIVFLFLSKYNAIIIVSLLYNTYYVIINTLAVLTDVSASASNITPVLSIWLLAVLLLLQIIVNTASPTLFIISLVCTLCCIVGLCMNYGFCYDIAILLPHMSNLVFTTLMSFISKKQKAKKGTAPLCQQ